MPHWHRHTQCEHPFPHTVESLPPTLPPLPISCSDSLQCCHCSLALPLEVPLPLRPPTSTICPGSCCHTASVTTSPPRQLQLLRREHIPPTSPSACVSADHTMLVVHHLGPWHHAAACSTPPTRKPSMTSGSIHYATSQAGLGGACKTSWVDPLVSPPS